MFPGGIESDQQVNLNKQISIVSTIKAMCYITENHRP